MPIFCHSVVSDSATLWPVAHRVPLSLEFSRQEYWSGLLLLPPGVFPAQRLNPASPCLSRRSFFFFFFFYHCAPEFISETSEVMISLFDSGTLPSCLARPHGNISIMKVQYKNVLNIFIKYFVFWNKIQFSCPLITAECPAIQFSSDADHPELSKTHRSRALACGTAPL